MQLREQRQCGIAAAGPTRQCDIGCRVSLRMQGVQLHCSKRRASAPSVLQRQCSMQLRKHNGSAAAPARPARQSTCSCGTGTPVRNAAARAVNAGVACSKRRCRVQASHCFRLCTKHAQATVFKSTRVKFCPCTPSFSTTATVGQGSQHACTRNRFRLHAHTTASDCMPPSTLHARAGHSSRLRVRLHCRCFRSCTHCTRHGRSLHTAPAAIASTELLCTRHRTSLHAALRIYSTAVQGTRQGRENSAGQGTDLRKLDVCGHLLDDKTTPTTVQSKKKKMGY